MNTKEKWIRILQILIIIMLNLFLISLTTSIKRDTSQEALSRVGSSGSQVSQIQTRLKSWGYYKGTVDGVYGSATKAAVKYFQQKNGLTADGVAGVATLRAIGISTGGYGKYSSSDYNLLARIISAEARGESYTGQVAVGAVVLNRVEHPSFPDTIAGVIYQPGAFSALENGQFNEPVSDTSYRAAQDAMNGWDPTNGAIYYYNPKTANSAWIRSRPIMLRIGNHVFCK